VVAPEGLSGFGAFLRSPPGLGVVSVACIVLGISVEETGTLRRIRVGIGLRLSTAAVLGAAALWAAALGAPNASLARLGWTMFALGAAGAAVALRHDLASFADPRHGEAIQLLSISADALSLRVNGSPVTIPTSVVLGAALATSSDGRGVFITVGGRDKVIGPSGGLPWVASTKDGDTLVLTEHQAALDAEVLMGKVLEAAAAGDRGGYR